MLHLRSLLPLALLLALFSVPRTSSAASSSAAAYLVVDHGTGHVLEALNPQKKLQIGSLTKIATAMVVLDWAEANHQEVAQMATVPDNAEALSDPPNGLGLHAGDQCSLRDLLYAALLQSDNRAALTLAQHVGQALGSGSPGFVAQMNALAGKLGMTRTHFVNPHGLEEGERSLPFSTAEDLGKLARYAMERAAFRFYVSQRERKISVNSGGAPHSFLLRNTNELLGVDGIDGVKTGTTRRAGECLIVSAGRAPESRQEGEQHFITPRRISVVVLGAGDRFGVARALLAEGWQRYDQWAAAGRPETAKRR